MSRINNHSDKTSESTSIEIYQLRIWLRNISPAIWRRILVRSDSSITDLHYTIQIAMGWSDSYLHQFSIRAKHYGIQKDCGICFSDNPDKVLLEKFQFRENQRFIYEYNFFDHWVHEIRVEKCIPFGSRKTYPVCIGGSRQAPPEDCGGSWRFMTLKQKYSNWYIAERVLEILDEGGDIDDYYEEFLSLKYWSNAERFDRRAINYRLKQYATGDEAWMYE